MGKFSEALITVVSGIIGVAIVALIVSNKSRTSQVIQAGGSAFANDLGVAESPVTGIGYSINTSYPSSGLTGFSPMLSGGFGV